jgi:hypothetical protein
MRARIPAKAAPILRGASEISEVQAVYTSGAELQGVCMERRAMAMAWHEKSKETIY